MVGGGNYFYTRDHLGSIRELTDNTGTNIVARYDYDPYGKRTLVSGTDLADYGFTGHYYHQPSGLCLTITRAYDANLGRWLSRDPLAEQAGLNLYAYVMGNPVNGADPLGLLGLGWITGGAIGIGIGLGAVAFALTAPVSVPVAAVALAAGGGALTMFGGVAAIGKGITDVDNSYQKGAISGVGDLSGNKKCQAACHAAQDISDALLPGNQCTKVLGPVKDASLGDVPYVSSVLDLAHSIDELSGAKSSRATQNQIKQIQQENIPPANAYYNLGDGMYMQKDFF